MTERDLEILRLVKSQAVLDDLEWAERMDNPENGWQLYDETTELLKLLREEKR